MRINTVSYEDIPTEFPIFTYNYMLLLLAYGGDEKRER